MVTLERVNETNAGILASLMRDPEAIVYAMEPPSVGLTNIYFLIRKDNFDIGYCDLHSIDAVSRIAWTTIYIRSGKATVEESNGAFKQLIDFAWNTLNLRKLHADNHNDILSRWMEKIGWQREGTLKAEKYVDGKYVDQNIFSLFREGE